MSKKEQLRINRLNYQKKQKREKLEEALKLDQLKLATLQIGTKEWGLLFADIEYAKEIIANGEF